jgi:molecular chaperone IbpA
MFAYDFSPLFRSSVGFDALVDLLETATSGLPSADGYPPYNIEKQGEDAYRITLNVAGFERHELAIDTQENWLVVRGAKTANDGEHTYLWRGIAPGSFERRFQLADFVKVTGATLADGLLVIDLVREVPEALKPRRVEIGSGKPATLVQKAKKLIEKAA